MAAIEVVAFPRSAQGKGASRRLRRHGKVPGIIYGGETVPVLRSAVTGSAAPPTLLQYPLMR